MTPVTNFRAHAWSATRFVGIVLSIVFVAEAVIMYCLPYLLPPDVPDWFEAIFDAGLLTLVCAPLIWWVAIRPLRQVVRHEQSFSSTLLNAIADGLIVTDEFGEIRVCNRAVERIFGYNPEQLLGRNVRELTPEDVRPRHDQHLARLRDNQELAVADLKREVRGLRKDGQVFPADLSLSELPLGRDTWYVALVADTSERKRREEFYHQAFERAGSPEFFANLASGLARTFQTRLAFICELPHDDGQWIETLALWADGQAAPSRRMRVPGSVWAELLASPACSFGQGLATRFPKDEFIAEWSGESLLSVTLAGPDGRPFGLLGVLHDRSLAIRADDQALLATVAARASAEIGNRRAMEALREAKRAADAATSAKSAFLANMSHEIRTPLTAILGFADNLLDPDLDEPERRSALETIRRNGEHLLELINDILDLSKIEAGRLDMEKIHVAPRQIAEDVVALMKVKADARRLQLRLECAEPLPASFETDPTRLRQILVNLLGNAVKFTEQGQVSLCLRQRPAPDARLEFEVRDTGPGISAEQLARLFQPFTQADVSTTRKFGGTGLGLTICRRLAAILGGDLTVDSRVGEGSVFRLALPLGAVTPATPLAPRASRSNPATEEVRLDALRLLVVEDGPDNRRLLSFVLKKAGATVEMAENGQQGHDAALAAAAAGNPFDLILMDMQMPVLDGYSATRKLREGGYSRPIIALTANAMSGDSAKCLAAGCDDYAPKPIDRPRLLAQITALVQRENSRAICAAR